MLCGPSTTCQSKALISPLPCHFPITFSLHNVTHKNHKPVEVHSLHLCENKDTNTKAHIYTKLLEFPHPPPQPSMASA